MDNQSQLIFQNEMAGRSVHCMSQRNYTDIGQNYGADLPDFIKAVRLVLLGCKEGASAKKPWRVGMTGSTDTTKRLSSLHRLFGAIRPRCWYRRRFCSPCLLPPSPGITG
jgi:hypothetical protein